MKQESWQIQVKVKTDHLRNVFILFSSIMSLLEICKVSLQWIVYITKIGVNCPTCLI